MTCIVGLSNDDGVFIAGDLLGSDSYSKEDRIDAKLFKKHNMVFGVSGSYRAIQLLQYVWKPKAITPKQDEMEYMVTKIIPSIIELFDDNHFLKFEEGRIHDCPDMIVGINKRLFTIYSDFQVAEPNDKFSSVGSGEYFAKGALKSIIDSKGRSNPNVILEESLDIAHHFSPSVGNSYQFITTDKLERGYCAG